MANPKDIESVRVYFDQHKHEIIDRFNATGAGIGKNDPTDDGYVIVVYLKTNKDLPAEPVILDDIPIKFEVTGGFELQN